MTERTYLQTLKNLMEYGDYREGRNGATYSLFGHQMRFDLEHGFPLLTTKAVHFHSVLVELLWFLKGDTNIKYLQDNGVKIWNEWADERGDLNRVYGAQWRSWNAPYDGAGHPEPIDQISAVIKSLKEDPYSRRHIVSAWNVGELGQMALPPCHILFQFQVSKGRLNCHLYQRSADWFLGVPFNIASYALLTMIIAREVGLIPGEFIHSFGDYHLYANHVEQAKTQLERKLIKLPLVQIHAEPERGIFDLDIEDFKLIHYFPHPAIKAPVSK